VPPTSIVLTLTVLTVCSSCSVTIGFMVNPEYLDGRFGGTPRKLGGHPMRYCAATGAAFGSANVMRLRPLIIETNCSPSTL
jgi:hypothetical protein